MLTKVLIDIAAHEQDESTIIVKFSGQIDESNLGEVKEQIDPLLEKEGVQYIIFHFKDLEFINSKVIGYLASLYSLANEQEKKLMIVESNQNIMDILALVGLTTIINHYDSIQEALEAITSERE